VRIVHLHLIAILQRWMSFGDQPLKIAENALGVVPFDPKAKVIEPGPLPRVRRVKAKKAAFRPQLTEVSPASFGLKGVPDLGWQLLIA
jgi:hypothetical protein